MKKWISGLFALVLVLSICVIPAYATEESQNVTTEGATAEPTVQPEQENPFMDVSPDEYYYEPILWAVKNDVTAGVSDTEFAPNDPCTRAQIITFMWSAAGRWDPQTNENPFVDIQPTDYFYKAVLRAKECNVTAGVTPDHFAPHQTCTRAQAITMMWASDGKNKVSSQVNFSDVSPDDYYYDAVQWAIANGITAGVGNGEFGPNQLCTRAQILTFIYKYVN